MQKNKQKLLSLLLTVVMVIGLLPMTAFAADTRIPISTVEATSTITPPVYGATIERPSFTVTHGIPAYFSYAGSSASWVKKSGDSWEDVTSGTFTEGTWRYRTQVRIDGQEGTTHVLAAPLSVWVNRELWAKNKTPEVYDDFSYDWVSSREYTVTAPSGMSLTFTDNSGFDIPNNQSGKAITAYSVASYVSGGTKPYTFSKTSGPNWIAVSSAGQISGTPTTIGTNADLVVRVTDNEGAYEEITISVGNTIPQPGDRFPISTVEATSTITPPVYGATIESPSFTVTQGSPAYFSYAGSSASWIKKSGDSWEDVTSGTFTEGTWRYRTQVRIDGPEGKIHVLAAPLNVRVNGELWAKNNPEVYDDFSYDWVSSPEYTVTEATTYTVTAETDGKGTASANPATSAAGTKITLTATPNAGKQFKEWTGADSLTFVDGTSKTSATAKFTMPANNVTVKAIFEDIPATKYTLTVSSGTGGGEYAEGTVVSIEANPPAAGKVFDKWTTSDGGSFADANSTNTTFTMPDKDVTVTATYRLAATVDSIAVNSTSHKTAYKVGESLDVTGLTIKATMSDSSTQKINVTAPMVSGFDSSAVAASQTLTITYDGKTTTYNISIAKADGPPAPTGLAGVKPTTAGGSDGKITGTTNLMEYADNSSFSSPTDCTGTEITGLSAGTYYVRIKETATHEAGTYAAVTVPAGSTATYTVTISGNGSGSTGSGSYTAGTTINIYAGNRSGYTFTGWTSSDVTITNGSNKNASFTMPAKNVTVKANWSYNSGGGGGGGSSSNTNATLSDTKVEFDKNEGDDLKVTLKSGSYNLRSIKNGSYTLREGKDYTISGRTVTIKASYLDSLKEGKHSLTFDMNGGTDPVLTIIVTDTTETDPQEEKPPVEETVNFEDVKSSDWFYDAVNYVYNAGLMKGNSDTTFAPYTDTTRGMIVTILHRLEGTPKANTANSFTDVGSDKYYTDAVAWASENKIVSGYGDGIFGPENSITREQLAVILMNYAKYKGYDVSMRTDLSEFADGEHISTWAKDPMSWANAEGLIQGSQNQLMPKGNAQRSQVAAILQRFLETIAK